MFVVEETETVGCVDEYRKCEGEQTRARYQLEWEDMGGVGARFVVELRGDWVA